MGINGGTGIVGSGAALGGSGIHINRGGGQEPFTFGNALQFDGVNDYVDISELSLSGEFTISMWINSARFTANQAPLLGHNTNNVDYFEFRGNSSVRLRNSAGITNFAMPALSTGVWYNYIFTRDASNNVRTYINNVESSTGSLSNSGTYNIENIGAHIAFGWESQGTYDEVAIWNTELSPTDRAALFNEIDGVGQGDFATNYSPANLQAYWRMNGSGTDTTAVDEQGNYDGTLNNFPASGMWVAH